MYFPRPKACYLGFTLYFSRSKVLPEWKGKPLLCYPSGRENSKHFVLMPLTPTKQKPCKKTFPLHPLPKCR